MTDAVAVSVAGLREDVAEAWGGTCPCSGVTALVVNACLGGDIVCYDLGLRGLHYVNRLTRRGQQFEVDLLEQRVVAGWNAPSAGRVCDRYELVANDDTFRQFSDLSDRLLAVWNGVANE